MLQIPLSPQLLCILHCLKLHDCIFWNLFNAVIYEAKIPFLEKIFYWCQLLVSALDVENKATKGSDMVHACLELRVLVVLVCAGILFFLPCIPLSLLCNSGSFSLCLERSKNHWSHTSVDCSGVNLALPLVTAMSWSVFSAHHILSTAAILWRIVHIIHTHSAVCFPDGFSVQWKSLTYITQPEEQHKESEPGSISPLMLPGLPSSTQRDPCSDFVFLLPFRNKLFRLVCPWLPL